MQIFQRLVVLLGSDANVVHTYAAVAVERLLAQKVNCLTSPLSSRSLATSQVSCA